ncbi:MAG TPA: hypothetical protein VGO59_02890 [Verrucomicrobiae bacterium]|jgi:hypothetical protein
MRKFILVVNTLIVWLIILIHANSACAQGTSFTYQGQLQNNGIPANGTYNLTFSLFNSNAGGAAMAGPSTNNGVAVANGLFTVLFDFGSGPFIGTTNWLEIGVETNGFNAFTTLAPRQQLTPAPYATTAGALLGSLPAAQSPALALTNGESGVAVAGSFTGNAAFSNIDVIADSIITNGSSFPQISNAFARGGTIWFQPGDYYNMSNIIPVNNTFVAGPGATLHFSPNCTGVFIDCGTNVRNFLARDIRLTGDAYADFPSAAFISPYQGTAGNFVPWYIGQMPGTYTNRSGLRINAAGGGIIENVTAEGFGAYGFILVSTNNNALDGSKTMFVANTARSNYCGCGLWAFSLDWAAPGSASGAVDGANDENQCITGCHFQRNGIGLYATAGNHNITGCNISGNWVGLFVGPGYNSGHGCVTGNTINHNQYATVVTRAEETIIGNTILDNGAILFDTPIYAVFANNHISGDGAPIAITATNSENNIMGQVTICNNWLEDNFPRGVTTNFNVGPGNTGSVLWYNNQTSGGSPLNSDGTPASLINQSGNPGGLTNIFNGSALPDIPIHAGGVTNTASVYGTAQLSVTSGSFTNFNAAGTAVLTNQNVTGIFTYPLGPGASIRGPGGLSGFIIFQ